MKAKGLIKALSALDPKIPVHRPHANSHSNTGNEMTTAPTMTAALLALPIIRGGQAAKADMVRSDRPVSDDVELESLMALFDA